MSQIASRITITPGTERKLKNRVSIGQTIHDSLLMAYRGLLKVRRTPEQLVDVTLQPILFTRDVCLHLRRGDRWWRAELPAHTSSQASSRRPC